MAEVLGGPLLVRLQELALSEVRQLVAVNDDIRRLRDRVMWLQAFLREADARRHVFSDSNDLTRVWLAQTREAVFDAEDAVDRYYVQLHMSRDYSQQPRLLMMHEEERKKLAEALGEGKLQNEDQIHHNPAVISVTGKRGVGKTTLVRDIYTKKKGSFDVHVMESFAPYLTSTSIIHQIGQRLTPDNRYFAKNEAHQILRDLLTKKKYLLVIDGEVSNTEWNNILDYLQVVDGATGSRIVHIAQNKPEEIHNWYYHHVLIRLLPLQQDSTIDLFRKWLSHTEASDQESQENFLEQKKETIYRITGGLPLAVVLLSGLVKTKEFNADEWITVFNYLDSKKSKRLESVLSVCLNDLPHELKSCFLYFAALAANTTIEAHILVCMWMAEGFLRTSAGSAKKMEKVGYMYLDELIYRNLVNPVHMDPDGSKTVTIQNKVHEFLQFEAEEASFLKVQSGHDIPTLTSSRRLSLQNYKGTYAALANPLPKLRSVFSHFDLEQEPQKDKEHKIQCCSPQHRAMSKRKRTRKRIIKSSIQGLLRGSEFLRVINLHGIEIGEKLSNEICNVVHLQYLGITSCSLKKIPQSIGRLTSLQTLDVRETSVRDLPLAFWMIKTLRHVFGFPLKLPSRIGGGLKDLQTLSSISINTEGLVLTLGEMINLRHLVVWDISEQNVEHFSAALERLENLRSLTLNGGIIPPSVFTSPSNQRVKFMVLQGELKLSELNGKALCLPNLLWLWLEETNICEEFISNKLAGLPSIETLVSNSGPAGFRRLKMLKID